MQKKREMNRMQRYVFRPQIVQLLKETKKTYLKIVLPLEFYRSFLS